jgi:hypothetical protein
LAEETHRPRQVGNVQMAFEETANRNHAHLRPDSSGWQTSTVHPISPLQCHGAGQAALPSYSLTSLPLFFYKNGRKVLLSK